VESGDEKQSPSRLYRPGKTSPCQADEQPIAPLWSGAQQNSGRAALYEFKVLPEYAVEYSSYYDFYQPKAYVLSADIYIDKEATINDELDKLRMSARVPFSNAVTLSSSLPVSCITHRLAEAYYGMLVTLEKASRLRARRSCGAWWIFNTSAPKICAAALFVFARHDRNLSPLSGRRLPPRNVGRQIDTIRQIDPLTGEVNSGQEDLPRVTIFPKSHYVMPQEQRDRAIVTIQEELWWWKKELEKQGKFVEAQRVVQRTMFDIE